jgi:hypothetical protein
MKVVFCYALPRVWLQRNTSFQDNHSLGTTAFGGGGVTVWGCFSFDCKLDLCVLDGNLTGQKYRDNMLAPRVVPHFDNHAEMKCFVGAKPSVGRSKKRLSSDQWTRLHVWIVHPKWSCDQSNPACRWRNVNCGRFMGRRARIPWWWRRLITVRVLMWPPSAKLPRSAPVYWTAVAAPVQIWAGPLSASFCKVYLHVDGQ